MDACLPMPAGRRHGRRHCPAGGSSSASAVRVGGIISPIDRYGDISDMYMDSMISGTIKTRMSIRVFIVGMDFLA